MSAGQNRIPSLDGLRTVSITFVVLGHLYGTRGYPDNRFTHFLTQYAHFGVQVFFVISGFLITSLLLREREKNGKIAWLAFYRRRAVRIFPACFTYIAIMVLCFGALPRLAYALTYTMCYAGNSRPWVLGHLWSLSVEEQFYLLWPLALLWAFSYRKQIGWAVLLAAPLARLWFWRHGMTSIDEYFPAVADSLAAGCLLALLYPYLKGSARWLKSGPILLALCAGAFATAFAATHPRLYISTGGLGPVLIALAIFSLIERRDWILNNPITSFMGALSYSLYLWQQPFLNRDVSRWWTAFPVNLLLALICAYASYRLVEKPMLRFKNRASAMSPQIQMDLAFAADASQPAIPTPRVKDAILSR